MDTKIDEIQVGDLVQVTKSPYSTVKNVALARVKEIKFTDQHPNWRVYILQGLRHESFHKHEIEKIII